MIQPVRAPSTTIEAQKAALAALLLRVRDQHNKPVQTGQPASQAGTSVVELDVHDLWH